MPPCRPEDPFVYDEDGAAAAAAAVGCEVAAAAAAAADEALLDAGMDGGSRSVVALYVGAAGPVPLRLLREERFNDEWDVEETLYGVPMDTVSLAWSGGALVAACGDVEEVPRSREGRSRSLLPEGFPLDRYFTVVVACGRAGEEALAVVDGGREGVLLPLRPCDDGARLEPAGSGPGIQPVGTLTDGGPFAGCPDGAEVAVVARDGLRQVVAVMDAASGREVSRFLVSDTYSSGAAAAWCPGSRRLAVALRGRVLLVDVDTGATLHEWPVESRNAFTADGGGRRRLLLQRSGAVFAMSCDAPFAVEPTAVRRAGLAAKAGPGPKLQLADDGVWRKQMAVSPDGELLAVAALHLCVFELATGRLVFFNARAHVLKARYGSYATWVADVVWCGPRVLATSGNDGAVRVWSLL